MTREEAARAFAAAIDDPTLFPRENVTSNHAFAAWLPRANAPLHEHLAFVGRIAESLGPEWRLSTCGWWGEEEFHVGFMRRNGDSGALSIEDAASDASWACLLAGTAALKGTK